VKIPTSRHLTTLPALQAVGARAKIISAIKWVALSSTKKRVAFANSCYMKSEQKQERSIRHRLHVLSYYWTTTRIPLKSPVLQSCKRAIAKAVIYIRSSLVLVSNNTKEYVVFLPSDFCRTYNRKMPAEHH
jgi:hypothetical protein